MFGWFNAKRTEEVATESKIEWVDENPQPIYDYFSDSTGIHFDQKKEIVTLKLIRFAKEHGSHSFGHLLFRLKSDRVLLQHLINYLTVNETYFFREMDQIYYMTHQIQKTSSPVRILCAPGSTGEEAYSIAIALSEAGVNMGRISIVSIDINTQAIACAQDAVYSKRSLHRVDEVLIERYFTLLDDKYHLKESICRCVEFKALNLFGADLVTLGKFDYIFSRNMLIYFDEVKTASAIQRLVSLVQTSSSMLFFGHADIITAPAGLREHYEEKTKFFTKGH